MTKRTPKQIEQSLFEQYKVWRRGSGTDLPPLEGGGTAGLGSVTTSRIPRNIQGPAGKPHYKIDPVSKEPVLQNPKVWRRGETQPPVKPEPQLKVWRRGEPESISPTPQTAQEKLVAQAQQRARETGEPTIAVTDPKVSKILDRLFPEKLSDLAAKRIDPTLDEEKQPNHTVEQYIAWGKKYAEKYNVPLPLVLHAMFKETGWIGDPNRMRTATSPRGATGVMQIMPQYAEKGYGIKIKDLTDPEKNIEAGVRGLGKYLERYETPEKALAAYNAGERGAAAFLRTGNVKTLPAETRKYVAQYKDDVMHQLEKFYPKNEKKVAQVATDILGTAVGAGNARAGESKTEKPGYYTVGDSHGVGIARPKTPWVKMSTTGSSAFDPTHLKNIDKIPPGSVVAISLGANDLGSKKIPDIVDQVNKTISAAQARGLQVVHLLPTSTTDPKLQQKRETLRQALLTGQTQAPIVNLGQASKKDPQELHLTSQGYQQVGDSIIQSFKPGISTDTTKPESFTDKLKRVASGELVSQVFGGEKKDTAKSTVDKPAVTSTIVPTTKDKEESWFEKLYGTKKAKEVQDQWAADTKRREEERKKSEVKPNTVQSVTGTIDYSKPLAPVEQPAAKKSADKEIELQRDQTGLVKAKRELSDFEQAFAAARAEQGASGTFTWTNPRTGKTGTYGTLYKGEKLPPKTVSAAPVDQALSKGEELVDIPVAQATDRLQPPAPAPTAPAKSEIQQALKDFDRNQSRKQDIERVIQQLANEPVATPAPRTAEELASDELWKDIRASAAGKSSEELRAAANKAMKDLDAKIAADRADAAATNPYRAPTELPGIELKEPTGSYNPPIDVSIDSEEQIRRQAAKDAVQDEMKESINNKSRAELHDILRLAGRLK